MSLQLGTADGGPGHQLADGAWSTVVRVRGTAGYTASDYANRGLSAPTAGQVAVAWWGTTTATPAPPAAVDLAVRPGWSVLAVLPRGVLEDTYPGRYGWQVLVGHVLTAADLAESWWEVGEADRRGSWDARTMWTPMEMSLLNVTEQWLANNMAEWWRPEAWVLSAASVLDVGQSVSPVAHEHAPMPALAGADGAPLFYVDPLWPSRPNSARYVVGLPYQSHTSIDPMFNARTRTSVPSSWKAFIQTPLTPYAVPPPDPPTSVALRHVTISTSATAGLAMTPVLLDPADGSYVDGSAGAEVSWTHRGGMAGPQTSYSLRRVVNTVTSFWNAGTQAWQSGQAWNSSSAQQVALPASAVPNRTVTALSVSTKGTGGASLWSAPHVVTWVDPPTTTVRIAGAGSAGVVADQTPTVVSSATPGDGAAVTAWEAQVLTAGGVLVAGTSGPAPTAWTLSEPLPNGGTFIARARAQQSGGMWGPWASALFTVQAVPPGQPVVTVAPTAHAGSGLPGLEVTAVFPDDEFPHDASTVTARLQRSSDGGASWATVSTTELPLGELAVIFTDYTAPVGAPVSYRVRGEAVDADGGAMWGLWGTSGPAAMSVPGGWVWPVADPGAAIRLRLVEDADRSIDLRAQRHAPIGLSRWILTSDVPTDEVGGLAVQTWNRAEIAAVKAILMRGTTEPLRLVFCHERDVDAGGWDAPEALTFHVGDGSIETTRPAQGPFGWRKVAFSWTPATLKPWSS